MKKLFLSRNIALFTLYTLFSSFVFETSIFVIFLSKKGISYSQTALLFSIYAFTVIIFEYLTGILADKYSRKFVLMLSNIAFILGELTFVCGANYPVFIAGITLMALSVAARSGADTAYFHDKLTSLGQIELFEEILSSLYSLSLVITALSCIAGSMLTSYSFYLPFILTIAFSTLSFLALIGFKEVTPVKKEISSRDIVRKNFKSLFSSKILGRYVLLSIIIFPSFHILDQLLQPYLKTNQVRIEYFGAFYTALSLAQAVGTKLSAILNRHFPAENILASAIAIIIFAFMLMSVKNSFIPYVIPIIMGIGFGAYYNLNTIVVNRHVDSSIRASMLSLQHALTKIVQMLFFAGISLFIGKYSIEISFLCIGVVLTIGTAVIYLKKLD